MNLRKIKISVIIPTYNSGKYVINPLESILQQTIDLKSVEVIIIDDVSTDDTLLRASSFVNRIPNLIIKKLDNNTGSPVIPRNVGLGMARGKYVLFMDNDDKIGSRTLERFYETAEKYNSDVIFGKYVGINGRKVPKSQFNHGNLYHADFLKDNLVHTLAPHKMFKLEFLRKFNIEFNSDIFIGEDQFFVMKAFVNATNISVLSDYEYYYVVNRKNENNLSEVQNKADPTEIYKKDSYILKAIEESDKDDLEKIKWKVSFLQRELLIHHSKVFSMNSNVQNSFLKVLKKEVIDNITVEMKRLFKSQYVYMIDCITELNGKKMISVKNKLDKIDSDDVVYVEGDGTILAALSDEKLNYDCLYPVNFKNSVSTRLIKFSRNNNEISVDVELIQKLLKNFDNHLELEFKNRDTKETLKLKPTNQVNNQRAIFEFSSTLFKSKGVYDIFIKATIKGNKKRRAIQVTSVLDFHNTSELNLEIENSSLILTVL